jgi:pimeloyl-ACP methyl ester carboxylesterase
MADSIASEQRVVKHSEEGVSRFETPVRFQAGEEHIFGMLTEPLTPRGIGVVLLSATSDRNRFLIRQARRLAGSGFHVLRFDYHGFGESSGPWTGSALKHDMITLSTLEEPFTNDLVGAVEEFHRRGIEKIVLIGRCFGSRTALSGVKHIRNLQAVALISLPIHSGGAASPTSRWALDEVREAARRGVRLRALRGLLSPRRRRRWLQKLRFAAGQLVRRSNRGTETDGVDADWVSEAVVGSLREVAARRVPVLFLYGRHESVYKDFLQAQAGPLKDILGSIADRVTVSLVDGPTNNLTNLGIQEAVLSSTQEWLEASLQA